MKLHTRLLYLPLAILVFQGCAAEPEIEGIWEGVMTTRSGPGFFYTIQLEKVVDGNVSGSGGVSIYTRAGSGADSTLDLDVLGTYRYPEIMMTISGPFPSVNGRVIAEFSGIVSPEGDKISGELSSSATGTLNLELTRAARD